LKTRREEREGSNAWEDTLHAATDYFGLYGHRDGIEPASAEHRLVIAPHGWLGLPHDRLVG
jgi:hypothetical protein